MPASRASPVKWTRVLAVAALAVSLVDAHGDHGYKPFRKVGIPFESLFESAASRQRPFSKEIQRVAAVVGPGDDWADNIYPFRQPKPWDISTDFPHPRNIQFDVEEGTWLRLDVHPTSGDIIFDLLGDLYCLPGSAYSSSSKTRAIPVLTGIPHDTAPRFSPSGDKIAYTSDAELGVQNIFVAPWKGCSASNAVKRADNTTEFGTKETPEAKQARLLREGRSEALRVTNETYRWVTDARFHPDGSKVIATKWYTSSRSLGAGEGWQYNIPEPGSTTPISPGSGERVVGRTLPRGWTVAEYGNQQIGPEQLLWYGNESIIYSKNVGDASTYTYSKDVHKGIYSIFSVNTATGAQETLVSSSPGGASRPELSRDQRTLAFVRRVRDKEALVFKDLETGTLTHIWHGLSYDVSSSWAPMGTYPSFAFTPKDDAVIIWAAGKIWHVPLTTNEAGEKIAAKESPKPIPFTVHVNLDLAVLRKEKYDLVKSETADTQRVFAFKELAVDESGRRTVFQAAGKSYYKEIGTNTSVIEVPTVQDAPYLTPIFVPGSNGTLVTQSRWHDIELSTLELANLETKTAVEFTGLPLGRYFSPVLSSASGTAKLAWIKHEGDELTGTIVATAQPGLYIGDVDISAVSNSSVAITNVQYIPTQISTGDRVYMRWVSGNSLLIQQSANSFVVNIDSGEETIVLTGNMASELVVSDANKTNVAFVERMLVYVTQGSNLAQDEAVWAKPGNATKGLARVSLDGGHDLAWNGEGTHLFWFLGPYLHQLEVSRLSECSSQIAQDPETFGISCVRNLVKYEEVVVEYASDVARIKQEGKGAGVVFYNANIVPMEGSTKVIRNGIIASKGGIITALGSSKSLGGDFLDKERKAGSKVIDAKGSYIVPGFLDVHAHWDGSFGVSRFPTQSQWELETFLAYGVTTVHNPSSDNVDAFWERSRLERGQFVGPRIFTTGDVIYGAGGEVHQEIVDMDEAYSALIRIRAEGGPAAIAYKNYNLPSRAARQRLLTAAPNITMLCVPEGGMNWDWDTTYFIDGMTTHEHSLPIPELFADILTLMAKSGTAITPTHVVHYGGAAGEEWLWGHEDLPNDPKLRQFVPHDILESITESTARPYNSWTFFNTSTSMVKLSKQGGKVLIGAHGEHPKGVGYFAELFFTQSGGLDNHELLRSATIDAAQTFGLDSAVGSLAKGKLADLVIFKPGVDALKDDLSKLREIEYVVRGGRVWKADTLEEVWPVQGRKQSSPILNPE